MKELWDELRLKGLTIKQRVIVWYFALSLCTLCVGDDTPLWIVFLLIANLANAVRLVKKIPFPETE